MKRLNLIPFIILYLLSCSSNKTKEEKREDNIFYDKAFEYRENGKSDSSFLYFNQAKDLFLQQKDSLGVGKCLVNMAIISTDKGDYFGGQEIALNALSYFDKKKENQYPYIHSNFNNLGIASYKLKDYSNALKFYDAAIEFTSDSLDKLLYLNNKAKTYEELKNYNEAIIIYNHVLRGTYKNPKEYARALANVAFTKWKRNSTYNAIPELLKALMIRKKENDIWGLNYSYARLADYYIKQQPDSALIYAYKMYQVAKRINSADDQLQALYKLIKLSPLKETKYYFEIYEKLEDSVQTVRNAAKNQFALIRYESEKQKADNLALQKDNTEKKYQIIKQKASLIGGLVLAFLTIVLSIILYIKRKQRLELETQNSIRENQLKISKKVHDRVANKVYHVMSEVENTQKLDKDALLDKLDIIYNISRDISYENGDNHEDKFAPKLSNMLKSYSSTIINVQIDGNEENLWIGINKDTKSEVFYILQEFITNMKKHSEANEVIIKFKRENKQINIFYSDNGKGMKGLSPKNGLKNTETRIKSISGKIIFDTKLDKGLEIQLSLPIS